MNKFFFAAAAFCCAIAITSCEKQDVDDNAKQQNRDPEAFTISIQENWSASLNGEPVEYDEQYFQFVNVTAPGIKYFWIDAWTEEEIKDMYGTLDSLILDWEYSVLNAVGVGYNLEDYLWTLNDDDVFMDYYDEGPYDIYIVEFDEQGYATGRIGITKNVTFPSISQSAPLRAPAINNTIGERPQLHHLISSARNLDV